MSQSQSMICKGCWQQMRVPASVPLRIFGIRPSRMNPNTCTVCELMFTRVMKARQITVDVSVLFADLRGYTTLSQSLPPHAVSSLLDAFYDECAAGVEGASAPLCGVTSRSASPSSQNQRSPFAS